MLKKTLCLIAFAAAVLPGTAAFNQTSDVIVEHNVAMKTRDGVTLYADMYRPSATGGSCAADADSVRQERRLRVRPPGRAARLHGGDPGCARAVHLRGRVVPLQA